jgi:hypothetical protein
MSSASKPADRKPAASKDKGLPDAKSSAKPATEAAQKRDTAAEQSLNSAPQNTQQIEGEHITQQKPTMGEALATGAAVNQSFETIGAGSVTEEAPAVRAQGDSKRVVQQGDEVIVHGRGLMDGQNEAHGKVLKANPNGTIAVKLQRSNGVFYDVTNVHGVDPGTGELYFTWPEREILGA